MKNINLNFNIPNINHEEKSHNSQNEVLKITNKPNNPSSDCGNEETNISNTDIFLKNKRKHQDTTIKKKKDKSKNIINNNNIKKHSEKYYIKKREELMDDPLHRFIRANFPEAYDENKPFTTIFKKKNIKDIKKKAAILNPINKGNYNFGEVPKCIWKQNVDDNYLDDWLKKLYSKWPYDLCYPNYESILKFLYLNNFNVDLDNFNLLDDLISNVIKDNQEETIFKLKFKKFYK